MTDATVSPTAASNPSGPPSPGVRASGRQARGTTPPSGPVLFARYAFGPNRLGLCGPEDWRSLLELGVAGAAAGAVADGPRPRTQDAEPADLDARARALVTDIDHGLRDLAARFEGAYPYLELIARAHGIGDVMDRRVVDAYWIGNALSDQVDPGLMLQSMDARFRAQLAPEAWRWLEGKPEAGARPTHAFHVFDVFPRVGLMRGGAVTDAVELMDSCRIRWGRVLEVKGEQLVVNAVPLEARGRQARAAARRGRRRCAAGWTAPASSPTSRPATSSACTGTGPARCSVRLGWTPCSDGPCTSWDWRTRRSEAGSGRAPPAAALAGVAAAPEAVGTAAPSRLGLAASTCVPSWPSMSLVTEPTRRAGTTSRVHGSPVGSPSPGHPQHGDTEPTRCSQSPAT